MQGSFTTFRVFERYLWHMVATGATLVFIFLAIKFFVVNSGQVNGVSMQPTFVDNDIFFINKMTYLLRPPQRYDVIQVIDPHEQKLLIKRVIGVPGDEIAIKRGKVFLKTPTMSEEQELRESYLTKAVYTSVQGQKDAVRTKVGTHDYFILGDNRAQSTDSRSYGPVPRSRILGKVIGKI